MAINHNFSIYDASAGSGKTFTLVKEYLKIILGSKNPEIFKRILAITFTNKAVAEMKGRIINTLKTFSDASILNTKDNDMFNALCDALDVSHNALHLKSKAVLDTIIHNYAAFDISTIDGFTHRIIRTFAYDLKLPINFEVELDQEALLNEAVDSLINKAGTHKALTNVLVDFAIEKADDDKSWDITLDFNKIAKILINENDIPFLDTLKDKTLEDFKVLKQLLKKEINTIENAIVSASKNALELIESSGLEFEDFSNKYLPNHFDKLSKRNFKVSFGTKWQENLDSKTLYPKRVSEQTASAIEQIQPEIVATFTTTKHGVFHYKFLKAFYKNITPLSVLNAINNELNTLKEDQNKLFISEFNSIISNEIKNQPTPFIYERLGEKFKYYFIDEFQDTSVKQWENLIPLIDNALSSEFGNAMLVGDAKQAIYRWRGGKAEQFMRLCNSKDTPFHSLQKVYNLDTNYRSSKAVVEFNNDLFQFLAKQVFQNLDYAQLYTNAKQKINSKKDGFVELSFLNIEKEDDRDTIFSEEVLKKIRECNTNGYNFRDITILVRKKKEGIAIANYLSKQDIPILSSETLLLANSPEINFINNLLKLILQPENNEVKVEVLNYLSIHLGIDDKHLFFSKFINLSLKLLFKTLEQFNIYVASNLLQLPLYDLVETIIRNFNLTKKSNAYLQYYLDVVLDFYIKRGTDVALFLDYFDKKKDKLSIVAPEGQEAVQVMTIHKSKGLEFPVVIFPYADLDLYKEIEPKEWFALDKAKYNGVSHTLLNFNSDFEYFGDQGSEIFRRHKSEQELDNINLLYVALTRPKEQLYIISKNDEQLKEESKNKKYSGLFINFLKNMGKWQPNMNTYSFGNALRVSKKSQSTDTTQIQESFISTSKEDLNIKIVTKSGILWNTRQENAIEKGNLIHDIMSNIKTLDDINHTLQDYINTSIITSTQGALLSKTIHQIISHPRLNPYFSLDYTILNERDIISKTGELFRPDRVVLNKTERTAVIIDYKTGDVLQKHNIQINKYQDVLIEMGYDVTEKHLVYINDGVLVKSS